MPRAEVIQSTAREALRFLADKLRSPKYRAVVSSPEGIAYLKELGFQLENMQETPMIEGLGFFVWVGGSDVAVIALDDRSQGMMDKTLANVRRMRGEEEAESR